MRYLSPLLFALLAAVAACDGDVPEYPAPRPAGAAQTPPSDEDRHSPDVIDRVEIRDHNGFGDAQVRTRDGRRIRLLRSVAELVSDQEVVVAPDLRQAAVRVQRQNGEQAIFVAGLELSFAVEVTPRGLTEIADIRFNEGSEPLSLTFTAVQDGTRKLFSVHADGSNLLVVVPSVLLGTALDPEGRILHRQGKDLHRVDPDGQNDEHVSTQGPPDVLTRFKMGHLLLPWLLIYSRHELYDANGVQLSTESGTVGEVRADKCVISEDDRKLVYFRELASSGRMAAFLVDPWAILPEPIQISPDIDADAVSAGIDPNGRFIWIRMGSGMLYVHEVGGTTRLAVDKGPNGLVSDPLFSPAGTAFAFGATPDRLDPLKAYIGAANGLSVHDLDDADEDGGRYFAWLPDSPANAPQIGEYLVRAARRRLGFAVEWTIKTTHVDMGSGLVQPREEFAFAADLNVEDLYARRDRWVEGDDPYRAIVIKSGIAGYRFANAGLDGGLWRPQPAGFEAKIWYLPNNVTAPPRLTAQLFGITVHLGMSYDGDTLDYDKNWGIDIDPDGDVTMYEWEPSFDILGGIQLSIGTISVQTNSMILDEQATSGRTEVLWEPTLSADSGVELFKLWFPPPFGTVPPIESAFYVADRDTLMPIFTLTPRLLHDDPGDE